MLPATVNERLRQPVNEASRLHEKESAEGFGSVFLPSALARIRPTAERRWSWQDPFPVFMGNRGPRSGTVRGGHLHEAVIQRAVKGAARHAGSTKPAAFLRSGMRLRRNCWRIVAIFGPSRSCSGTRISAQPSFVPLSRSRYERKVFEAPKIRFEESHTVAQLGLGCAYGSLILVERFDSFGF